MEHSKELKSDEVPFSVQSGKTITKIEFHEKLGVIFVGTSDRDIFVIDPTLGDILYHTSYQSEHETEAGVATAADSINKKSDWDFMLGPEKIIVVNKNTVGIRGEYQGIILLSTILQTPVKNSSDPVEIELNITEAESLGHSLAAVDVSSDSKEVGRQLKSCLTKDEVASFVASVKREKWSTVKLELPHSVLKTTFQSMVTELWKKNAYIPQLSIASSILERLNMLLPPGKVEDLPIDKTQMFSESARLNTFSNCWPHRNFRWALPERMAEAGFYHNPASSADDRALCFTCNVCLVSWEPTDEPWSEHERHSPFCPFVRGEHTHNVPLYLSYATAPAFSLKADKSQTLGTPNLGKSSFQNAGVVAYSTGLVIVWDIAKQREAVQFEVKDEEVEQLIWSDVELKPKEAWVMESDASMLPLEPAGTSHNCAITVSSVAVLGVPVSSRDFKKPVPPSVVVGATVNRKLNGTEIVSPVLLVYGVSSNAISCEDSSKDISTTEIFKAAGSTGTKQETQVDEDELFVSYMSESDLMSDSVIFSDLNMSDSSGTFIIDSMNVVNNSSATGIPLKKKATLPPKKVESSTPSTATTTAGKSRKTTPNVFIHQKINLPLDLQHCYVIRHLLPSLDGSQLIVVLECGCTNDEKESLSIFGAVLVYNVKQEVNIVTIDKQPILVRKISDIDNLIVSMCLIPPEVDESLFACVLRRGDVTISNLSDFLVVNHISRSSPTSMITSVSYCTSMERLCCGTNTGVIELYQLNSQTESDSDKQLPVSSGESISKNCLPSSSSQDSKLIAHSALTNATMKQLLNLTTFENLKPCFTANVPSCWVKIIQAQKERKHPQHLQHHENEANSTTLSWRLQRNKSSKKEHLFELSLPKAVLVGHLDLKFILQMGCVSLPTIEVTLYRAKNHSHIKSRSGGVHEVDKSIDFGTQLKLKTPSNEFLSSINAELVCGPLDLAQFIDLSGQGGTIVMTSPSLMLTKGRNFYLHIKAKSMGKSENVGASSKSSKIKTDMGSSSSTNSKSSAAASAFTKFKGYKEYKEDSAIFYPGQHPFLMGHPIHKAMVETPMPDVERIVSQSGCDWLHEISISIRQSKKSSILSEEHERRVMLTSESFVAKLLNVAVFEAEERSYEAQNSALDLLVWIASVKLCGPVPQLATPSFNYQLSFIHTIQRKLNELILHGVLYANRSTSHKTTKLLVLCIDAVENYYSKEDSDFLSTFLKSLLSLLPFTISCNSAGSLQWYFLLLNRVRTEDLSLASESLLNLLKDVSQELHNRTEPLHALLRTRFGLYGTPFEPELFEIELPPVTKSYSHPLTYAGLCGGDSPSSSVGSFHLWGLKDVDFRDLLGPNPLSGRWGKVGVISPKQQIQGLLEVEPLHFTCHAASDGTRIEQQQFGVNSPFSAVPFPQPWESEVQTQMPVGEGSKKSEPDKAEQIMMLQKALKMDTSDMQCYEQMYLSSAAEVAEINALLHPKMSGGMKNVGVLTMVMGNPHGQGQGSITLSSAGGPGTSSKVLYNPQYIQPTSFSGGGGHSIFSSSVFPQLTYKQSSSSAGTSQNQGQFGSSSSNNPFSLASTTALINPPMMTTAPATDTVAALQSQSHLKQQQQQAATSSTSSSSKEASKVTTPTAENDNLRLLLSPWQQMMYVPPQQALVIDRMHSGARRFVVLDFGAKVLLTDMVIPSCNDLVSLSIDIWLHREELDGQRLVVASDIGSRSLVICDLQPPPVCRYLKMEVIGRYGMGTTRCRIPVGMFYGQTVVLPSDVKSPMQNLPDVTVLSPTTIQSHLSVLSSLVEDIGCRYQLSCSKLRRQLDPLLKSDIFDHISYYLPKGKEGKERNKLGLNTNFDHGILSSYQECITLQQQLNVAQNVVKRLKKTLCPNLTHTSNPLELLSEICTDKVHVLSEFVIESLLGISFIATSKIAPIPQPPLSLYLKMDLAMCEALFRNICVLENGQCQLSTCTLMLRVCSFRPWWGKFLAKTLKSLFSSSNSSIFPQDRVFILLVYLGQKALLSGSNSVLESAMELLAELLLPIEEQTGFLRSKVDMRLIGWVIMFLCLCLDGISGTCTLAASDDSSPTGSSATSVGGSGQPISSHRKKDKDASCPSSRWDFIQAEIALYRRINGPSKSSAGAGGFKRRIQKKIMATKQKIEELDNVATGLGYANQGVGGLGTQLSNLGNKLEAIKQKQASIGKNIKLQSSKHFKDLLQIRRTEMLYRKGALSAKESRDGLNGGSATDVEMKNLNLSPSLCLKLARGLGLLLLRMDSTCHSDMYLISCKALARIATSCRPSIPFCSIFSEEQIIALILTAVGVRQRNWSSSWVSHAVMCLIQDILEGEKLFPQPRESKTKATASSLSSSSASSTAASLMGSSGTNQDISGANVGGMGQSTMGASNIKNISESIVEDMSVDIDAVLGAEMETTGNLDSEDSEFEDILSEISNSSSGSKKINPMKASTTIHRVSSCVTGISTALDARLETAAESAVEVRLRMIRSEEVDILTKSLKAPIEIPSEVFKTITPQKSNDVAEPEPLQMTILDSCKLLASSFGHIFQMISSENCSVSTEKVLGLWISINLDSSANSIEDGHIIQPSVPLSHESVSALMMVFTKHTRLDVQLWGLAFQTLTLVANQKSVGSDQGDWLYILKDKNFAAMILRFISGSGSWVGGMGGVGVLAGPTVCQQFYNFLLRMRELSNGAWTSCLKEMLLRILLEHLSGPFLNTEFPLDAFNKFLDRVTCPDLSYESASTVINIIEQVAQILHLFVFFPNKINIRSNSESKTAAPNQSNNSSDVKFGKTQNFEHVMFRLVTFMSNCVALRFKAGPPKNEEVATFLKSQNRDQPGFWNEESLKVFTDSDEPKPKTLADIVLKLDRSMMRILSLLANPNGIINVLVSGDLHSAFGIIESSPPTTVVDGVIQLFSKLSNSASQSSSIVQPIFRFLSKSPYDDFYCPLIVSETFVLFVLKVMSNKEHLKDFTDLKCVESVCEKLIQCTRKFFSNCASFVSILTQYIGRTDNNAIFGQKKFGSSDPIELPDGLMNVAPLGTISSSNYSAHPSDSLLQVTPPHRRARTPVWSYHFLPEEDFLELIIVLPCAILLKEVQIVPHMTTSLQPACPSAVMVEVSRNQNSSSTLPMGPVECSGLSTINVQIQPEVAQKVLIRLFKPKDSNNLGLSQIRLLGSTTFSEAALEGLSTTFENVKSLEASAHWMYIIDRAISVSLADEALHQHIVETAGNIPDFLDSCFSMLMAPIASVKAQEVYLPHVSSVLYQIATLSKEISEQIMRALLGPVQRGFSHGMAANANPAIGVLSQLNTVVELLFNLCCNIPHQGYDNLVILVKWLETKADEVVQVDSSTTEVVLPEYVQAVAATLWSITNIGKTDLSHITTPILLKKLLAWTRRLDPKSELKATLDHVICSMCYNKPYLFIYLMYCIGFIKEMDWIEIDKPIEEEIAIWAEEGCIWDRVLIQGVEDLTEGSLITLGRSAQSPSSAAVLRESQFLEFCLERITDFWTYYTNKWIATDNRWTDVPTEAEIAGTSITSTQSFIGILKFFSELCRVNGFKNWFGTQGSLFWLPILNLLSTLPGVLKANFFGTLTYDLESTVITFLSKCCWSHPENQNLISDILCDIVKKQKIAPHKAVFLHSMSSFCRRLLIQLLLENEKVIVHVKSSCTQYPLKTPTATLPLSEPLYCTYTVTLVGPNGEKLIQVCTTAQILDVHSACQHAMQRVKRGKGCTSVESALRHSFKPDYDSISVLFYSESLGSSYAVYGPLRTFVRLSLVLSNHSQALAPSVSEDLRDEIADYLDARGYDVCDLTTILDNDLSRTRIPFGDICNDNYGLIFNLRTQYYRDRNVQLFSPPVIAETIQGKFKWIYKGTDTKFSYPRASLEIELFDGCNVQHFSFRVIARNGAGSSILHQPYKSSSSTLATLMAAPPGSRISHLSLSERHPSMGVKGGDRTFYISTYDSCSSLLKAIEPFGVTLDKIVANSELLMGTLIDQIQKRPVKTATKKLKPEGATLEGNRKEDVDKAKGPTLILESEEFPDINISPNLQLATLMAAVRQRPDVFLDTLVFTIRTEVPTVLTSNSSSEVSPSSSSTNIPSTAVQGKESPDILSLRDPKRKDSIPEVFNIPPLPSTIETFSRNDGLRLLAKYLPVMFPCGSQFTGNVGLVTHHKESPVTVTDADWVKIESADDFYDEMMDSMTAQATPNSKRAVAVRQLGTPTPIPPHSMAAFGLFLGLPKFSEVLLGERIGAQCMLRLVMGVSDDAEGSDIFGSAVAKTLPTLPFQVLRALLDVLPLNSEEGIKLRRAMTDIKAIHFILACLAVFTHHNFDTSLVPGHELVFMATKAQGGYPDRGGKSDDKSHVYWAKGTGFGTGSTTQSWDIDRLQNFKKMEEVNATILFKVLSSFLDPRVSRSQLENNESNIDGTKTTSSTSSNSTENCLPREVVDLFKNSCLFPAIAAYLRNDSVLDMSRHVPLYKAVLQFLRSLVSVPELVSLLAFWEAKTEGIPKLLSKMKDVVDNYSKRLTANTKGKGQKSKTSSKAVEDVEDEGMLIPDIQSTAVIVQNAVSDLLSKMEPTDVEMRDDNPTALVPAFTTLEDRYLDEMKKLQFGFYDMITEDEETGGIRFTVSHHYEGNVRNNWTRSSPSRLKRLAQESVTLSTSLPLAFGSAIFARCDTNRLDIMKVLITGPAGTPYANGCFEFDVFFPNDYPTQPMMINLETTGRQRVRFNPNLYTDGKVCLSILNTWHGRPEERWNPQTSSLLPVLVAIQSLILNAEPYFNEPGYEKSRSTEAGERNSREYNAGIEIATVEWGILDQIKNINNSSSCFKEVIHRHFWMKRSEILAQCEKWLENLIVTCRSEKPVTIFRNNLALLKKEFANMKPPEGLEDMTDLPDQPKKDDDGPSSSMACSAVKSSSSNEKRTLKTLLSSAPTDTAASGSMFDDDDDEDDDEDEEAMIFDQLE